MENIVDTKTERASARKQNLLMWGRDIAIAIVLCLIVVQFIRPTIVNGSSMEDTLHDRDYLLVNKQANKADELKYGDIIVFHSDLTTAENVEMKLIKRVIGVPGDRVYIKDGSVYVNDTALDDAYTKEGYTAGDMEEVTVPGGAVFVMGDNRQNSEDSRFSAVGFVTEDRLVGRAFFRVMPFRDFGGIK
jgi:signal peptidase I